MADELPPAVQDFIADVDRYIGPLEEAIAVCEEFIAANERAAESALKVAEATEAMAAAVKDAAAEAGDAAQAEEHFAAAEESASHGADSLRDALAEMAGAIDKAGAGITEADAALARMAGAETEAAAAARVLAVEADDAADDAVEAFERAEKAVQDYEHGLTGLDAAQAEVAKGAAAAAEAERLAAEAYSDARTAAAELTGADKAAASAAGDASRAFAEEAISARAAAAEVHDLADAEWEEVAAAMAEAAAWRGGLASVNDVLRAERDLAAALKMADSIDVAESAGRDAEAMERLATEDERVAAGLGSMRNAFSAADQAVADSAKAATAAAGFWSRWGQVIHWVISGSIEFLAVAIPAIVAFGAAMLVGMQGAQMMQEHLQSLYTATEATANMFHETFGQALGLKDVLQQAQNAANPKVYALLGAGLGIVKEQAGGLVQAGSKVIQVFDEFAAHLRYDFSSAGGAGGTMGSLLKAMVPDLIEFGQVFGNIGHAIANFASKMPGLAEVLLKFLDVISRVILWVSKLPTPLIMAAMAMEEIWRWGGPLVAILTKIPIALEAFVASGFGVIPVATRIAEVFRAVAGLIPTLIADFSELAAAAATGTRFEGVASAVAGFSSRLAAAIEEMTVFDALAGAAFIAAIVGVGIALDRTRSATEQYIDSMNRAVQSASQMKVLGTLATAIGGATSRISAQEEVLKTYPTAIQHVASSNAQWTQQLRGMEGPLAGAGQGAQNLNDKINTLAGRALAAIPGMEGLGKAYEGLFGASHAAAAVQQLTAAQKQWEQQSVNVVQGAAAISHEYGVNFVGALALAQAAGVKLENGYTGMSQAAQIARLQVADLVAGYQAMGQDGSAVSGDMEVLAVQSGLAGTQVQKLTQAMQQYMQEVTGGTAGLAGLVTSIQNLGSVVGKAGTGIGNLGNASSINLGKVSAFAKSLNSMGGQGAQAWTNFDQVMGQTMPNLIGWFQTAGAMGVLSGQKMKQGMLDALSGIVPYAQGNKAAEATVLALARQNLGTSLTWGQLTAKIKETHASMADANKTVQETTVKMGDLMQVAQNLGNVMSTSIIQTMDQAKLSASGLSQEASTLASDLAKPSTPAKTLNTDIGNIYNTVLRLTGSKSAAETTTKAYADSFGKAGQAAYDAWQKVKTDAPKIPQAMQSAADNGRGPVGAAFRSLGQAAYTGITSEDLPGKMRDQGTKSGQGMHTGLTSQLGTIGHWGSEVYTYINNNLNALPGELAHLGLMAAEGLARGLASGAGAIINAASSLASLIPKGISKLLSMGSPSRVTMQQGEWAAQGLAIGITNGLPGVIEAAHHLANVVPGGLAIGANGVPLTEEAEKVGKDTIRQLVAGLTGSTSQIKAAINDITNTIKKAFLAGKLNTSSWSSYLGEQGLLNTVAGDNKKLQALAAQRNKIAKEIQAANAYATSVTQSMESEAGLGNLTQPTSASGATEPYTVASVQAQLTSQLKQMQAFDHNIDVLRKEGLSKQMIAQIVAMGYQQGGSLAQALAHGSASQIKDLNDTEKAIIAASKKIGKDSAESMYGSGKDAGKGFLAGLKSEEKAIDAEIKKIADNIVKAIRKALKSKSPSQVMHDEGMNAALGLANGLAAGTPMVLAAARKMAEAVSSVKISVPVASTHPMTPSASAGGGGAPMVVIHQHIAGTVVSEQQLQQHIQTQQLRYTRRNLGNGLFLQGRASGTPAR